MATLVFGLREDSRTVRIMSGNKLTTSEALLAGILDQVNLSNWMNSKDGQKNRNRPESILNKLLHGEEKKNSNDVESFDTPEEWQAEFNRLVGIENG